MNSKSEILSERGTPEARTEGELSSERNDADLVRFVVDYRNGSERNPRRYRSNFPLDPLPVCQHRLRNIVAADPRISTRTRVSPPCVHHLSLAFRSFICVHLSAYHQRRPCTCRRCYLANPFRPVIDADRSDNSISRHGTMNRLINDSLYRG